jgi:phosphoenolpyruvate carboxylase
VHDPAPLEQDLARLSDSLLASARTLGGAAMQELLTRLVGAARELRVGDLPGGRRAFAEQLAHLTEDQLEEVARAEALWCHLMNIAEERQRLRTLRARGDHPPDGLAAAIDAVIDQGATADEVRAMFDRALVMPVITAHPTEARRRTTLDHLGRIGALLDELEHRGERARTLAQLDAEVLAFHATEDARARRPTPLDEVESSLQVFNRSLLDVTPRIYRTLEDRLAARFGGTWRLPTMFRWGTWVGGDRDGNPNVTAAVTRGAFARQRTAIVNRYLEDLVVLGRSLSLSELRAHGDLSELHASLERDRERLPEVAARARPRTPREPWR